MDEGLLDQKPSRKDYSSRSALGVEREADSFSSIVCDRPYSPPPPVDCTSTQSGSYDDTPSNNDELGSPIQESDKGKSGKTSGHLGNNKDCTSTQSGSYDDTPSNNEDCTSTQSGSYDDTPSNNVDCTSTQSGSYNDTPSNNDELGSPIQETDKGRSGKTSGHLGNNKDCTSTQSGSYNDTPSNNGFSQEHQHNRLKKSIPCILSILIPTLLITGLLPNYFIAQKAIIDRYRQQDSSQAIAQDVIDCDLASITQKRFISEVEITQIATNENFDNKKGLPMNIVSIPRTDLQFHNSMYTGTSSIQLTKDIKTLIIPDGYVNRPVYLWTNSNITVQHNISNFTSPPNKLVGYIFRGDDNFLSFYNNPSSSPNYEYSWNILDSNEITYTRTIKRNGYYYIVVTVQTEHNFTLSTGVEFDILYLSSDDYDLTNGQYVDTVGTTIKENLDFDNNKITLCFVGETTSQKLSIHVVLSYNLRTWFVLIFSLMEYAGLIVIFVILLLLIIFCLKNVRKENICKACECFKIHYSNSTANEESRPLIVYGETPPDKECTPRRTEH